MKTYAFETWDVFTKTRFEGNPLAVIPDAAGLSDEEMQTLTREFNLAETVFVLPPKNPENTARLRIFTPSYEMPFAGHPTVGASLSIARSRTLSGLIRLELNAGIFPVRIDADKAVPTAQFENPNLPAERGPAPDAGLLEAALSLPEGSVDRGAHKPRRVGAGVNFYYFKAPLDAVRRAKVNSAAWERLDMNGVVGVLLYAEGGENADASYHVRMFAPDAGVPEDPATGGAAAALPGQIALSEKLADGAHQWVVEQGFEMGRPSRIEVEVEVSGGAVKAVRIGGAAIPVSTGEITV